jgi:zinc protease
MVPRILTFCFSLIALAAAVRAAPPPVTVEGATYVRTVGDISEYTLNSNGLQILLMPEHSAPVLTFMVTYRVGSRNEVTGTTGATHLLEHLMFKGTEKFQRSKGTGVDQLLEQTGANYNATTWLDRTNYYANIASDRLALVVEMEADRMRNLLLREEDRQPEMTVVRNEFERGENSPFESLSKELYANAYLAHPYHHSTIGWRSDIEKVSIEKLREFYDTFYWPDNATVSVIGDFDPAEAINTIKMFYGAIPRAPKPIPQVYTEEPEQTGPRRVIVKRSGELGVVAIAHKSPAATHRDYPAVSVLSAILTDGKNSRFYRALTDKNLTTSITTELGFHRDNSLHIMYGSLAPNVKHEQVEKVMLEEIERLKKDGVTDLETTTAINKILADNAFKRDGSFAIADNLNESIASGDWTTYYTVEDATRKVTAADVKRVANEYLREDQSTTGWFIPITEPAGEEPQATGSKARSAGSRINGPYFYRDARLGYGPTAALETAGSAANTTSASFAKNVVREKVAGIDLLVYKTGVRDVVTIRGSLPAGDSFCASTNPAIATLVGHMLDKGTQKHDKFAISQQLETAGANLSFAVDNYNLQISGQCLRKDLPLVISLIAEMVREPAFSADEFEKLKKELAGAMRRRLESPDARCDEAYTQAIYPAGHPNRDPSVAEILKGIESAKLEDLKSFHKTHYGPKQMILVAVGDLDAAEAKATVASAFNGWTGGTQIAPAATPRSLDQPREQVVFMSDKPSVTIELGQRTTLKYGEPDYFALRLGTAVLGSGFTGRLMANVRDKEGLTYGIESWLANDTYVAGDWRVWATFAPALLDKGIESTRRQVALWYEKGITAEELTKRKSDLIGSFKVNLATTKGLANQLLVTIQRGLEPSFLDKYAEIINGLTLEQVNSAIKKHLNPDKMVLVQAGTVPSATTNTAK